jgi:hypothetical protein
MRHEATDVTGLQVNQRQVSSPCTRRVKASRPAACWSWQKGLGAAAVWTHGRSIVGKKLSNSRCRDGRLFCSLAGRKGVNFPLHGALSRLVGQHARVRAFSFGGVAGSLPNSQFYVFTQIHPPSPVFVLGDWPRAPAARRVLVGARRLVCFSSEGTRGVNRERGRRGVPVWVGFGRCRACAARGAGSRTRGPSDEDPTDACRWGNSMAVVR